MNTYDPAAMTCPHCGVFFQDHWRVCNQSGRSLYDPVEGVQLATVVCPRCMGMKHAILKNDNVLAYHPSSEFRQRPSSNVPAPAQEDYEEAVAVLPMSPKASAALARRCLEWMLREQGFTGRNLAELVAKLADDASCGLAKPTRETVDHIRGFGNFAAHAQRDVVSGEIVGVEAHEAETCLELLLELFDHFYDKPAEAMERKLRFERKVAATKGPRK